MKFSRISITGKGVELDYVETKGEVTNSVTHSCSEPPLGSFKDALQGFASYVVDLIPFFSPAGHTEPPLTITTLNLSEDKNGLRGLIVTATWPVERAYNKPLIINTPLVREGGELPLDDAFVLTPDVMKLIALVEGEATRYRDGEYGTLLGTVNPKEFTGLTPNMNEIGQRMADAEVSSTRKPKGKKKADPLPVADEVTRQLLRQVERDIPVEAIGAWTYEQRIEAVEWATARVEEMLGQRPTGTLPEPTHVARASTLPLAIEIAGATSE